MLITFYDTIIALQVQVFLINFFLNGVYKWHLVKKKYTILLLSAPIGSGHKLAAQALEQSFALADNVQVVHGSIF